MQVHQLVPALHDGDAIGDSARALRDYLRQQGYHSEIYAYVIDESIADEAIPFRTSPPVVGSSDTLILHFALPSGMTEFLKQADCKRALIYHNITPAYFWLPYDSALVHLAHAGREELRSLADVVHRSAGDSEYNRLELEQYAFRNTCVLPIYVQTERYNITPSFWIPRDPELFTFLAVGRVAPNKKLEDILRLYFFYKKIYSLQSRVIFVGKTNVTPGYYTALKELISRYGLLQDEVIFTGHVDWPELVACYKSADVFVSMSAHEGFCVPLVEAMICDTPILAYASTAIPYVLGDAGIQVKEKRYPEMAAICQMLKTDDDFREHVLTGQRQRRETFSRGKLEESIKEFLSPLL